LTNFDGLLDSQWCRSTECKLTRHPVNGLQ